MNISEVHTPGQEPVFRLELSREELMSLWKLAACGVRAYWSDLKADELNNLNKMGDALHT